MDKLFARRLSIIPTTRCNLNCELCLISVGGRVKKRDFPIENVCNDVDAAFALFDHVEWLQLFGGEVFIYRDFAKLLNHLQKYRSQIDRIVVQTNATVFPDEETQQALIAWGEAIIFIISDYGERFCRAKDQFVAFSEEHHMECRVKTYWGDHQHCDGWYDVSNPYDLKEPGDVLEVLAKNCAGYRMQDTYCFNGKLFRCNCSCFFQDAGVIPVGEGSFVDLYDNSKTREEKQEMIRDFYRHAAISCRYCKRKYADISGLLPRYPAAVQVGEGKN